MGNPELARWLRQQRQQRGWSQSRLAREIIAAGLADGDHQVCGGESMLHNIYRWERHGDGPHYRYRSHVARALGIPIHAFGPGPHEPLPQPPAAPAAPVTQAIVVAVPPGSPAVLSGTVMPATPGTEAGPYLSVPANLAYGGMQAPEMGDSRIEREVLMAAHESSESASRAEERGIGEMTLEQFRADVSRLSREYMTGEPFALFLEMRRVRDRMDAVLERRLWPRDARDLYLLLGCINDLMAIAANALGYPQASDELVRAAWAYAVAAGHHPLMARVRCDSATNAYWDQPKRSAELALNGLEYQPAGPNAALLHVLHAQAAARDGDAETARSAIAAAQDARQRNHDDDLLALGGEFNFSHASQLAYAGQTLLELRGAHAEAETQLQGAIELYEAGPESGEDHSHEVKMWASANLATARLRGGQVDGAVAALAPVLDLPPGQRVNQVIRYAARARAELSAPIFRGSAQATDLAERIEEFRREAITAGLHGLSGGPA